MLIMLNLLTHNQIVENNKVQKKLLEKKAFSASRFKQLIFKKNKCGSLNNFKSDVSLNKCNLSNNKELLDTEEREIKENENKDEHYSDVLKFNVPTNLKQNKNFKCKKNFVKLLFNSSKDDLYYCCSSGHEFASKLITNKTNLTIKPKELCENNENNVENEHKTNINLDEIYLVDSIELIKPCVNNLECVSNPLFSKSISNVCLEQSNLPNLIKKSVRFANDKCLGSQSSSKLSNSIEHKLDLSNQLTLATLNNSDNDDNSMNSDCNTKNSYSKYNN